MNLYKMHIATFLLAGFLFPQVASSMHYFLVPHYFSSEDELVFTEQNIDFQYHSCVYHLNAISAVTPTEEYIEFKNLVFSSAETILNNKIIYNQQPHFNFQLRGPPLFYNFLEKWLLKAEKHNISETIKILQNENEINLFIQHYCNFIFSFL